jgi:hypothetical protein
LKGHQAADQSQFGVKRKVARSQESPAVRLQQTAGQARTYPAGEFVSERLLADCERFLRDTRRMSEARKNAITSGMRFR